MGPRPSGGHIGVFRFAGWVAARGGLATVDPMSTAPTPPPIDDKDWTWVLERPCPECGFEAGTVDASDVASMLRANAAEWQDLLRRPDTDRLRARPDAEHWSALEYACHVRDVFEIYDQRLALMLAEDGPHYPNWDQDASAVEGRYDQADPGEVAAQLMAAGLRLAARFDTVGSYQWARTGFRGDGARFTVETFARYFIHDPVHHLDDVAKGFVALGDAS